MQLFVIVSQDGKTRTARVTRSASDTAALKARTRQGFVVRKATNEESAQIVAALQALLKKEAR